MRIGLVHHQSLMFSSQVYLSEWNHLSAGTNQTISLRFQSRRLRDSIIYCRKFLIGIPLIWFSYFKKKKWKICLFIYYYNFIVFKIIFNWIDCGKMRTFKDCNLIGHLFNIFFLAFFYWIFRIIFIYFEKCFTYLIAFSNELQKVF